MQFFRKFGRQIHRFTNRASATVVTTISTRQSSSLDGRFLWGRSVHDEIDIREDIESSLSLYNPGATIRWERGSGRFWSTEHPVVTWPETGSSLSNLPNP